MPEMDGLAMSKVIREKDPQIPILILTGYNEFDYARTAVRLNISDYLLKPIDEQELAAALSAMAIQAGQKKKSAVEINGTEYKEEHQDGLFSIRDTLILAPCAFIYSAAFFRSDQPDCRCR